MGEEAAVTQERQIIEPAQDLLRDSSVTLIAGFERGDREPVPQGRDADADQAEESEGEGIGVAAVKLAPLEGDEESVFFPGSVEERDEAVIEEIEPFAQSVLFPPFPL